MSKEIKGSLEGQGLRFAIVVSRFNDMVTHKLLDGAVKALRGLEVKEEDVTVCHVPGSLELGVAAKALAESKMYDAVICLGCVIRGETGHYEVVATQSTAAIARVAVDTGVPVITGVLTTENMKQAMDRAGGAMGNKGQEAAETAVEMANLMKQIRRK
ncbi:MAG: 6,7-dimethyl-8-ribityllumazine synthase [SAR202 cluster bacterium]|nr:6,7-dimethyl-8-ribityllumazine synthase [SAR202 cluster bacterium]